MSTLPNDIDLEDDGDVADLLNEYVEETLLNQEAMEPQTIRTALHKLGDDEYLISMEGALA